MRKEWLGIPCCAYETDKSFFEALKNGTDPGGWVVAPAQVYVGASSLKSLRALKISSEFGETFRVSEPSTARSDPYAFWTSTRGEPHAGTGETMIAIREGKLSRSSLALNQKKAARLYRFERI